MPTMAFGIMGGSLFASSLAFCIFKYLKLHCVRMGKPATGVIHYRPSPQVVVQSVVRPAKNRSYLRSRKDRLAKYVLKYCNEYLR